jgi:hypothetical protein
MLQVTEDQVAQLAPDAESLKSGRALANIRKWQLTGMDRQSLWGEIQGSGKEPYRTQVDLGALAFKCTCPSRKFPCKHGLGLLFISASGAIPVRDASPPAWVSDWIQKRRSNAQDETATKIEDSRAVEDPKKAREKAKREAERLQQVQGGAAELDLLLRDLLRTGLMNVPEKGEAFFDKTLRRMVDAKASGLANLVRNFTKIDYTSANTWPAAVLENAAKTWLLLEAFKRMDQQPQDYQEQIKTLIGWAASKKELLENTQIEVFGGSWLVLAKQVEPLDEQLLVQKIWLYSFDYQKFALLVDYAPSHLPFPTILVAGTILEAEIVYYPSSFPLRAQIKQQGVLQASVTVQPTFNDNWTVAQAQVAAMIGQLPWIEAIPLWMADLTLVQEAKTWYLSDRENLLVEMDTGPEGAILWRLLAHTGGHSFSGMLLRVGHKAVPLGIFEQEKYLPI